MAGHHRSPERPGEGPPPRVLAAALHLCDRVKPGMSLLKRVRKVQVKRAGESCAVDQAGSEIQRHRKSALRMEKRRRKRRINTDSAHTEEEAEAVERKLAWCAALGDGR